MQADTVRAVNEKSRQAEHWHAEAQRISGAHGASREEVNGKQLTFSWGVD